MIIVTFDYFLLDFESQMKVASKQKQSFLTILVDIVGNQFQINCLLPGVSCLPPNTSSVFQLMDACIIDPLKARHRCSCIQHQINCLMSTQKTDSSIDIYQAVKMLEEVWRINVATTTIRKCWKHVSTIFGDTLTSCFTDTSLVIASHNVEIANVSMWLNRSLNYHIII